MARPPTRKGGEGRKEGSGKGKRKGKKKGKVVIVASRNALTEYYAEAAAAAFPPPTSVPSQNNISRGTAPFALFHHYVEWDILWSG